MDGEASHHNQTDSAASHSFSRMNTWELRAERRQSMRVVSSPD